MEEESIFTFSIKRIFKAYSGIVRCDKVKATTDTVEKLVG